MFCTKCGYNLGEANFCPMCGNPAKKPVVAPVVEQVAAPVVENVAETVAPVVENVAETVAPVVETVTESVAPVEEVVSTVAQEASVAVEKSIAPVVESVEEIVADAVEPAVGTVEETVAEVVEPVTETVEETVSEVVAPVAETVDVVTEEISEAAEQVAVASADEVTDTITPVIDNIENKVDEAVSPVTETVDKMVQPVVETVAQQIPVVPVQQAAPVMQQPVQQAAPVMQQPVQQPNNPNLTWNNESQQMWNTYQPKAKKKSKAPIIIGVVAALLIAAICAGVFLVWPMIKEKKQAEETANIQLAGSSALKSVTAELKNSASTLSSNLTVNKVGTKQKMTGSFTLKKLMAKDRDAMTYFDVNTVNYVVELDSETGNVNALLSLSNGDSTPVANMQVYTEGTTAYIKIPELSGYSLKTTIEVDTDENMNAIVKAMSNMDEETMKQYAKVIESVIGHMVTGLDYVIDKAQYTKNEGTVSVSAGDFGTETCGSFFVAVNKADVIDGFNKTVDAIFDDSSIVPYITMLSTVGKKIDKEELKTDFADSLKDAVPVFKFTMYTKDNAFAGIGINATDYDPEDEGTAHVITVGGKAFYMEIKDSTQCYKMTYDGRFENKKLTIDGDMNDEYMTMYYEWKQSATSFELVKLEITGKVDGESIAVIMSAKSDIAAISSLSASASDFADAIDTDNATEEQQKAYQSDVAKNMMNLMEAILSDKAIEEFNKSDEETTETESGATAVSYTN